MLFTFMFVLVDTGLQYLNIYINKWFVAQKERVQRDQAKKAKASKSVIRRKVTVYNSKYSSFKPSIFASGRQLLTITPSFLHRSWICFLSGGGQ